MFADNEGVVQPNGGPREGGHRLVLNATGSTPISTSVVLAVSSLTGLEPTEMRPLHGVVDPDALNQHVDTVRNRAAVLSFEFHGYRVRVRGDGNLEITAVESPETAPDESSEVAGDD